MSKKTVPFKMPARDPGPVEAKPAPARAPADALAPPNAPLAEEGGGSASDQWVERREAPAATAAPSPARAPAVAADLAPGRDLTQAAALMLLTPAMLGWSLQVEAINRFWRRFA
ncbi:MAG: hypothetical protein ABR970_00835 [Roseiarcus sp.]|jgi:hypothetical protein